MGSVELIAAGYEWICPECQKHNTEIETLSRVQCNKCDVTFDVRDYHHALKG